MNVKVSLDKLGKRAAFGAGAAVTVATAAPVLLTTHGGLLAMALVFLAGMITVAPGDTGLVSPVNPESVSVAQKGALMLADFLNAPKAKRDAQQAVLVSAAEKAGMAAGQKVAQQAVQDYLEKSGQFTAATDFGKLDIGKVALSGAETVAVAVGQAVLASEDKAADKESGGTGEASANASPGKVPADTPLVVGTLGG